MCLYASEFGEHENGTVRHQIINSNRQNPGRDVAKKMEFIESIKHIVDGGYYRSGNVFIQPGFGLRYFRNRNTNSAINWEVGDCIYWFNANEELIGIVAKCSDNSLTVNLLEDYGELAQIKSDLVRLIIFRWRPRLCLLPATSAQWTFSNN